MAKMILVFNLDDVSINDTIEELNEEGNSATYVYESVVDDINDGNFSFAILEDDELDKLETIHKGGELRSR